MTWQGPDTDATREGSLCSRSNGMLNSVPKGQIPALNWSSFSLQSQRPSLLSLPALLVHKLLVRGGRLGIRPNLRNLTHPAGSWSGQEAGRGSSRNYRAPAVFRQTPPPFSPKLGAATRDSQAPPLCWDWVPPLSNPSSSPRVVLGDWKSGRKGSGTVLNHKLLRRISPGPRN